LTDQDRPFYPDIDSSGFQQGLDVRALFDIAKRRALYFILPFLLAAVGGAFVVTKIPPVYEAHATILVESQQIPEDLVKSTVSALAAERLQVIEQLVKARDNVLSIANKFNLLADRKDLSQSERVEDIKSRIVIAPVELSMTKRRPREDRLTIAFTVSFEDENPATAARVANELVTIVLNEDAKSRSSRASETTKFLEKEAQRVNGELANLEKQIADFRLKNTLALPEKLQFNMSILERTEKNAADTERDILAIDEEKRLLTFEANVKAATSQTALTGTSPTAQSEIERQLDSLKLQYAAKTAIYAPTHPEMRSLKAAMDALEQELQRAQAQPAAPAQTPEEQTPAAGQQNIDVQMVDQKIKSLDERRAFLVAQAEGFKKAAADLKDIIVRTPEIAAQLGGLERQRDSLQRSMDDVNSKLAQARLGERLEQDQQGERFEVIEQPITPQDPIRPNRKKLLVLSLAAAAAAGGGVAFASEFLDTRIRTTADYASRIGGRPFAVVPYIPTRVEKRRRFALWTIAILLLILVVAAALAAVHFLVMPLDEIVANIMLKLQ